MGYILDIATAVPENQVRKNELVEFYLDSLKDPDKENASRKIRILSDKAEISTRYSCIPDFNSGVKELFVQNNFDQPVEKRMELYKHKVLPLSVSAVDKLFKQTGVNPKNVTHLITVSCTGVYAPGLEFHLADHYSMIQVEKTALNFLGCYAALKALKYADYITESNREACVLILSVELCSLHFTPSVNDEDILANLLFADGAAAAFVCGRNNRFVKDKTLLKIDKLGSAAIPHTSDLMTWNVSSGAFRMHLSRHIANSIGENMLGVAKDFLNDKLEDVKHWAVHPGGVRIVEAVRQSLSLSDDQVADSLSALSHYGNMSSATILFILNRVFNRIRSNATLEGDRVFACAFGPGLNVEMISMSSVINFSSEEKQIDSSEHAVQLQIR